MLFDHLKVATQPYHYQIERQLPLRPETADRAAYRDYLIRLYGYYRPAEARIMAHTGSLHQLGLRPECRRKVPWLQQDLRVLGLNADQLTSIPCCLAVPSLPTVPAVLGCLYVLEGATLGGQILYRLLTTRLDLQPATGASFITSYGTNVGGMWRCFRAVVSRYVDDHPETEAGIVAAATATFASLRDWLLPEAT